MQKLVIRTRPPRPKYEGWRMEPPIQWSKPGTYTLIVASSDGVKRIINKVFRTEEELKGLVGRWRDQKVGNVLKAHLRMQPKKGN